MSVIWMALDKFLLDVFGWIEGKVNEDEDEEVWVGVLSLYFRNELGNEYGSWF